MNSKLDPMGKEAKLTNIDINKAIGKHATIVNNNAGCIESKQWTNNPPTNPHHPTKHPNSSTPKPLKYHSQSQGAVGAVCFIVQNYHTHN